MNMPETYQFLLLREYFFEPAQTHMMKVEGDRAMFTDFIIFEVGAVRDVDTIYHAGHSDP
ncbi:MAG TPA: hypothetical protein VIU63_08830 [Nitrospira sp.]